jgi:hypothetical protein
VRHGTTRGRKYYQVLGVAKIVDKQGEGVVYPLGLTSQEQGDQPQGWAQGYCTVSDESVQEGKE